MISDVQAFAWTDLELPLAWHNLSICAGYVNSGVKTCLVVHVSNNASEAVRSSDRTVIGTLGAWVAIVWPAKRPGRELG